MKRRVALDAWTENLPAALVINGHTLKNALPHILMLQLAKEWCTILIYRPYYRPVAQMTGSQKTTASSESLLNLAVRVRHPLSSHSDISTDELSDVTGRQRGSTPFSARIISDSDSVIPLRPYSTSLSRPALPTYSLPFDITERKYEIQQWRTRRNV